MLPSLSPQSTLKPYAFRPYEDQWHGSSWDEAAQPEVLPSLMQVLRELLTGKSR
jgi:hypothetical protein